MRLSTSTLATTALVALAIVAFAGNSLLARAALADGQIGPGSFTAIRLAAGAIILLPWFLRGERERLNWRGALALFGYCGAFSFAYVELNAATGAMVLFAAVQMTILVAGAVSGNRLRALDIAGVVLAMAGVVVLLGARVGPGPVVAMLSMIAAGVAWGVYSVLGRSTADPARRTAGNFLLAAMFALPLPLFDAGQAFTTNGIMLAIMSGAITSGLGYVAWYKVIPRLPHATIGAAQLATPVVAAIAAAALLGESLTARVAVAAALILGGVAATFRRS